MLLASSSLFPFFNNKTEELKFVSTDTSWLSQDNYTSFSFFLNFFLLFYI